MCINEFINSDDSIYIGVRQTLRALRNNQALRVYVAKDADQYAVREVCELAKKNGVQIIYVDKKSELGKKCKIDVDAATVVVVK